MTNKKHYLYEVDLMRIIFIFGVLLNHTTSAFANSMTSGSHSQTIIYATHLALHFTRMGFMFVTGLVLFLNYYPREQTNWFTFWRKRYTSVGIPYLAWNAILLVLTSLATGVLLSGGQFWSKFIDAVIHGNQFYLYYVFVIFQLYLIFPILVYLFKKFANQHNRILIVSFIIQVVLLTGIKYGLPHIDRSSWPYWFRAYGMNILVYQVYFIAGAYVSIHYQAVVAFLQRHAKRIYQITAVAALGTLGLFYFNREVLHLSMSATEIVHQPYVMIYALLMVAVVFLLGLKYAEKRTTAPQWFQTAIHNTSRVSFGIYLAQTIPLALLSGLLTQLSVIPDWGKLLLMPLGYLFVVSSSFLIAWFCYKVPPFGILIGRPQKLKHLSKKVGNKKGVPLHD